MTSERDTSCAVFCSRYRVGMSAKKYHTREEKLAAKAARERTRRDRLKADPEWAEAERERSRERQRARRQDPEERKKDRERHRARYYGNHEAMKAKKREWMREMWRTRKERGETAAISVRRAERMYGLPAGAFAAMEAAQGGVCAACKHPPGRSRLFVDHCHKTGKVRALLCHGCNAALGLLLESPERIMALHAYAVAHA